jgi:hypothetical protein
MLVEDWLGASLDDFGLQADIGQADSSIGHDAVIEEIEVVAPDDTDPHHPLGLILLLAGLLVGEVLDPDLADQRKEVDLLAEAEVFDILI